jgi:hypothetical protein
MLLTSLHGGLTMLSRITNAFLEHRAIRHFTMAGFVIVMGGITGAHVIARAIETAPSQFSLGRQTVATLEKPATTRTYTTTRSVLDDDLVTGTTGGLRTPFVLDPCTGEQKKR